MLKPRLIPMTLLASSLLYCSQTSGDAIVYQASAGAALLSRQDSLRSFVTAQGWTIELSEARVLFGPVFFFGGGLRAQLLQPVLGMPSAYAHPSDDSFDKGPVLGEVLDQHVLDVMNGPTDLGFVPGVAGVTETLEVQLQPPGYTAFGQARAQLDTMRGYTFVFEGVAKKDGVEVPFLAQGNLTGEAQQRVIGSIEASVQLLDRAEQPGWFHIEFYIDEWFRFVDFGAIEEMDEMGRARFPEESNAGAALRRGIRSRFAFGAQWRIQ